MPGVTLARSPDRKPGDIDFWIVRENNEGEYSSSRRPVRSRAPTTNSSVAGKPSSPARGTSTGSCSTRSSWRRSRPKQHLTSATKSNGIPSRCRFGTSGSPRWRKDYPGRPRRPVPHRHSGRAFRACTPTVSTSSSAAICSAISCPISARRSPGLSASRPRRTSTPSASFPSMFEPVHGSAPDIAGRGIANPIGADLVGRDDARSPRLYGRRDAVVRAIEAVLTSGPRTRESAGPQRPRWSARRPPVTSHRQRERR